MIVLALVLEAAHLKIIVKYFLFVRTECNRLGYAQAMTIMLGQYEIYCDVRGSPCLSKTSPVYGPFFKYIIFRIPGPMSCCCLEPGWFVGDPTPLARDNMYMDR